MEYQLTLTVTTKAYITHLSAFKRGICIFLIQPALFMYIFKSNKYLQIIVIIISALSSCKGQQKNMISTSERDTTITIATAFSKLFLDSAQLEVFIKKESAIGNAAGNMRDFYRSRNYQFAWFTETGIAEHTRSFWNLHNNYISDFGDTALKYKHLHKEIGDFMHSDTAIAISPQLMLQKELQFTKHFFEYSKNLYTGKVDPNVLKWYIPRKKINEVALLDSFLSHGGKKLQDWEPLNIYYQRLKKELIHYHAIDEAGGWKEMQADKLKKYKPGDTAAFVKALKVRLQISGEYKINDTTSFYTPDLIPAVKLKQRSFGLREDGVISYGLIKALNVPVKERIRQMLINLERMRWVPQQQEPNIILVNIPEYRLHVFEAGKKIFSIDIVVGKEANGTVIFSDQLKFVVFSPYWNIPASIAQKEILPAIRRNGNYLARMNMELTGNGFRQKPGGANALGKVKFIFPNNYNIYFHDTPSKSLFNQEKRAFSHGCIRLAEPQKLAAYLLRFQPEWTTETITEAMNASAEKWVPLKKEVPVFISYFTTWVDGEGLLNFRDDVYSHDKRLAKELFE